MTILESLYQHAYTTGIAVENFPMPRVLSTAVRVDERYYIGIDRSRLETSIEESLIKNFQIETDNISLFANGIKLLCIR